MITPIRAAILGAALFAASLIQPSSTYAKCMVPAEFAETIMTEFFYGDEETLAARDEDLAFYMEQTRPYYKRAIYERFLQKIGYLSEHDRRWFFYDDADKNRIITAFKTTTFLACKSGVS